MKKAYPYIVVLLLLVILGLLLFRTNKDKDTEPVQSVSESHVATPSVSPTAPQKISVAGMQQYTDKVFGFSFWYPTGWEVTVPTNSPFGVQTEGGTVVKVLGVQPIGQTYPDILIKEFHSATRSVTDTGGAGPFGPVTYFFDPTTHLWMVTSGENGTTTTGPADISVNSMGGLHLFGGTSRFDTRIIPLSANNFVVINDGDGASARYLESTVTATNPAVASPVSAAEQIQTIQAEAKGLTDRK